MMKMIKNIIFSSDKEKITENAFKQSIAISIFGIILCMIALCSATWAWFSVDISSSENNIQSAYCNVTVIVKSGDNEVVDSNGKYTFEKDKDYVVTIEAEGSAESAYCIFVIDGKQYYTAQISTLSGKNSMTFTLKFTADTQVEIITRWGSSSKPEAERLFINGGYYLDLERVESLPTTPPETGSTAETTSVASEPEVKVDGKTTQNQ